jgi:two-component sensor histidine kinase
MTQKRFYPLLLLLFSLPLTAQDDPIDILKSRLSNTDDPEETVLLLGRLTDSASVSDLQELRTYALQARRLGEGKSPEVLQARAYLIAGKAYTHLTSYDSAIVFLDRSLTLFDPVAQAEETAETHHWKGYVKANQREFGPAAEHYYQAVEIWERIGRRKELTRTYTELADMHAMQEEYDKAIGYAQQSIEILKIINEPEMLADALNSLSYTHVLKGDPASGLKYAAQSIAIWEQIAPDGLQVARVANSRGNAHKFLGNYAEALLDYERCRNISERKGVVRGVIVSTANIGHTLLLQKQYAKALPYTLRAIELMQEAGDTRNLGENLLHAANSYGGLGDYQNAHHYMKLYNIEKEREYEQKIAALKDGLAEKYEAGQRAATIVMQEERIEKQRNFQRLLWGFVALLLLTSLLIYMSLRSRQKANRMLGAANEQLAKKNQENELLLREIHHRVKNNLQTISSLLNLQSAGIEDATALAAVQESRDRVRSMSLIHQKLYQGEQLASVEMKDYFETMGQAMLQSFGPQARHVTLKVDMPLMALDVDTAIPIGLIVNELMTNSLKYAFPDQREGAIEISLCAEDEHTLALRIADNGAGSGAVDHSEWRNSGTGFGNRLVQLLVQQLGARIEQTETGGFSTVIRFSNTTKAA